MEGKIIRSQSLEGSKGKPVKVSFSDPQGEKEMYGLIGHYIYVPWFIEILVGRHDSGCRTIEYGEMLNFIGPDRGIIKIEGEGGVLFENSRIPVPYRQFDVYTDEGQQDINNFRNQCFGEGFDYSFETANFVREELKKSRQKELEIQLRILEDFMDSDEKRIVVVEKWLSGGFLTPEEASMMKERIKQP